MELHSGDSTLLIQWGKLSSGDGNWTYHNYTFPKAFKDTNYYFNATGGWNTNGGTGITITEKTASTVRIIQAVNNPYGNWFAIGFC